MKIKSIKLENNKIFGNIFLDFTAPNGDICDTIIFAGENACGKTAILEIIYEFSDYKIIQGISDERREFKLHLSNDDVEKLKSNTNLRGYFSGGVLNKELIISFDCSTDNWGQIRISFFDSSSSNKKSIPGHLFNTIETRKILRSIYTAAEISFTPRQIKNVKAGNIDQQIAKSTKSTLDLATDITQLIVDIQAIDDSEFAEWGRSRIGETVKIASNKLDSRMRRFKEAFNSMFPNKRYKEIRNINNVKKVIFEEFGKEIPIESLSSGEKQIVFRGGFLLKDKESIKGALVLIDEPEISLHPIWQLEIMDFYKKLFTDKNGMQTSQIFVATHSPFIVHNDIRLSEKVVVLKRDDKGKIFVPGEAKFHCFSNEEKIEEAFNIQYLKSSSKKPVILAEGDYDVKYINRAAELYQKKEILNKVELKDGGGHGNLTKVWKLNDVLPKLVPNEVILFYDCDINKKAEKKNNCHKYVCPFTKDNPIKKGIENLFGIKTIERAMEHKTAFIDITDETTGTIRGRFRVIPKQYEVNKDEKGNLCNWLCKYGAEEDFKNFLCIFDFIDDIVKGNQ